MISLSNCDYADLGEKLPILFRLPQKVIGIKDWKITRINLESKEVTVISDVSVQEVCRLELKSTVDGFHTKGSSTIKLKDSTSYAVGQFIRIGNYVNRIIAKDSTEHIITIASRLEVDLSDSADVAIVLDPEILGVYVADVPMTEVGLYSVSIVDSLNTILPVMNMVEVSARNGDDVTFDGKIIPISGNAIS